MSNTFEKQVPRYSIEIFSPKKNNTALVIPIINEGERILLQLKKINSINPGVDIIIADGGSTDGILVSIKEEKIQIK